MTRWRLPSLMLVVVASQLGATDCDGNITRDPGFDLWCDRELCAWKVERGSVRRVGTWHDGDAGVELVLADTAIEQLTPVDFQDGTCIRFDLIADVEESAQVELNIDVYSDGSIERTFALPTAHWRPVSYEFAVAPPFTGIRFELAKRGDGRAVLARMRAHIERDGCNGVAPIATGPAPLGALCRDAADCATGLCRPGLFGNTCVACLDDVACAADQVCGVAEPGPPERAVPIACVAAGARALGEQCVGDGECETGMCTFGWCSACNEQGGCDGVACGPAYLPGPSVCGPSSGTGAPGAACGRDEDCRSKRCTGEPRRQCSDGRACATDANCPVDGNLRPGACSTVGVQGGSCA